MSRQHDCAPWTAEEVSRISSIPAPWIKNIGKQPLGAEAIFVIFDTESQVVLEVGEKYLVEGRDHLVNCRMGGDAKPYLPGIGCPSPVPTTAVVGRYAGVATIEMLGHAGTERDRTVVCLR